MTNNINDSDIVITSAFRTPIGSFLGSLSEFTAVDLGTEVIKKCIEHSKLNTNEVDMVYMGQTIEHIMPEFLPGVLEWIGDHLAHNGKFIFDTPNRLITAIQSDAFIDPDHKIEYTPNELRDILHSCNFSISDSWGLLPMPKTFKLKKFSPQEVYDHALVSNELEISYLFAFSCERN